jgi:anti-sigma regulatory factor (Ser/Thr protein kinase)
MTTTDHTDGAVLFLRLEPTWAIVDDIRQLVAMFCATTGAAPERQEQLALAAHELVQNAVSHATSGDIELELSLDAATDRVAVSVTNRAHADQIAVLRTRLARALAPETPLDAYLAAMREDPHSRGGIGLARIRFEAGLELSVDVRGELVTIHASGPFEPPDLDAYLPGGRPERARAFA